MLDYEVNSPNLLKLRKMKIDLFAASFDFYIIWTCICTYTYFTCTREIRIIIFQADAEIIKDNLKIKIVTPKMLVNDEDMAI